MDRNPAQVAFYKSTRWLKARAAYLESQNHVCERCGGPATIVHHKRYITPENVNDPSVTLSFDNLEAVCQDCHNTEHHNQGVTANGLRFDEHGNLVAT